MDTPDVAATVASLRVMRQQLQDIVDNGDTVIDGQSNASVLYTSQASIDALEAQGNQFLSGDYSPFGDSISAWAAWADVCQSTGDSLASSTGLNAKWTITYTAGQVGAQAAQNLEAAAKAVSIGAGAGLVLVLVIVLLVKL